MNKENFYFESFNYSCDIMLEAFSKACDTLKNYDQTATSSQLILLHNITRKAYSNNSMIKEELHKSFITPIERSDIINISAKMQETTLNLELLINKFVIWRVKRPLPDTVIILNSIELSLKSLKTLVLDFANYKKSKTIMQNIKHIERLRNEQIAFHYKSLEKLISSSSNWGEILAWKDIFECLDSVAGLIFKTSSLIENVVLTQN